MVVNVPPSDMVWSGMFCADGASFSGVTVNVTSSVSVSAPVSSAVKVMVSAPFQSLFGMVIVAMLFVQILSR